MLLFSADPQITVAERRTLDDDRRSWLSDKQRGIAGKTVAVTGFFDSTIARDISFLVQVCRS